MPIRRHPIAAGAVAANLRAVPIDVALAARLRSDFEQILAHELRLGELFYARLFEAAPHLRSLFKSTPEEQARKLIASLESIVRNFEDPESSAALLAELGRRHASYGAKAEHYVLVIDVMIESMAQLFGPRGDPRRLDEWRMALRLISDQMIAATGMTPVSGR